MTWILQWTAFTFHSKLVLDAASTKTQIQSLHQSNCPLQLSLRVYFFAHEPDFLAQVLQTEFAKNTAVIEVALESLPVCRRNTDGAVQIHLKTGSMSRITALEACIKVVPEHANVKAMHPMSPLLIVAPSQTRYNDKRVDFSPGVTMNLPWS